MSVIKTIFCLSMLFLSLTVVGYSVADSGGFTKIDVKIGTGGKATPGKNVSVHYTGWLFDEFAVNNKGDKFDSSRDRR